MTHVLVSGAGKGVRQETAEVAHAAVRPDRAFARSNAGIHLSRDESERFTGGVARALNGAVILLR